MSRKNAGNLPRMRRRSGPKRLLIVDDDLSLRGLLAEFLRERNCQLRCVDTGEEALTVFQSWMPDLLLLDVSLPGLSKCSTTFAKQASIWRSFS